METSTVILQTYKRPSYLLDQINAVKNQTIKPDRIVIVHNDGGENFDFPEDAEVILARPNRKYHLRFAVGLLEETDYLFFYDDDTLPGAEWHENCINTIKKHDCICVTNGRDIVEQTKSQTCPGGWCNPNEKEVRCWFGGHSWALRKKNLKYMWYDDPVELKNGEDIQLSANAWLFNEIPTYIPPHPKENKALWGSLKGMLLGSDPVASYLCNPTHYIERWKLIEYYLNKGWQPII
jgi:hypothetical protein